MSNLVIRNIKNYLIVKDVSFAFCGACVIAHNYGDDTSLTSGQWYLVHTLFTVRYDALPTCEAWVIPHTNVNHDTRCTICADGPMAHKWAMCHLSQLWAMRHRSQFVRDVSSPTKKNCEAWHMSPLWAMCHRSHIVSDDSSPYCGGAGGYPQ